MNDNQESLNKFNKNKTTQQGNDTGNEEPSPTTTEEAKAETEYYEEGNGGATD